MSVKREQADSVEFSDSEPSEVIAHKKGYRANSSGDVFHRSGRMLRLRLRNGYPVFGVRSVNRRKRNVSVHRLVAYQKFGSELHKTGIQVRHLDGNPSNNSDENIAIGTASQNTMDKPVETRVRVAANANLKHDRQAVLEAYARLKSLKKVCLELGISSKGTVHYIVHGRMVAL